MDVRRIFTAVVLVGMAAVSHDAIGAGQAGWSGGATQQPASGFDRYNQQAVPSISQRTQTAITDPGNSVQNGLDAGIRAGEQSLGAGGTQPQSSYLNRGGAASPWPASTSTSGNSSLGTAPVAATPNGGWSSIGTGIAAPKLLVPQSPMANSGTFSTPSAFGTTSNFGNGNSGSTPNSRGPNFPAVATNDQSQMHSVLNDPARSTPTAAAKPADDWINNWNNSPTAQNTNAQSVTIGRNGSNTRESEPSGFPNGSTAAQEQRGAAAGRQAENWSNNGTPSSDPWGRNSGAQAATAGFGNPQATNQPAGGFATQPNNQGFNGAQPNGMNGNGTMQAGVGAGNLPMGNGQAANGMNQFGHTEMGANGPMTTQPAFLWVLLVLVLAASLAGNFYLGASYLDARQKYQSLVRKTAETFRRVKAAAT
ncbi:MAG TPA: hypothetical protein VH107_19075 [Lacipirellulaceae bacterium]|jgi:hypothetical protein|nr:hypothetical protein [Lacipirellulaceae bacterium]